MARTPTTAGGNGNGGSGEGGGAAAGGGGTEIGDELQGLPLEYLIAAPFAASTKAQIQLGKAMIEFINLLAYGKEGMAVAPGGESEEVKTLRMKLERPVIDADGKITTNTVTVAPPILGLVPIPSLLIETVDVNFSMEIHAVTAEKATDSASVEAKAEAHADLGIYGGSVTVTGKVSAQRENTRSTDKTAKYDITVHAAQQDPTEGMAKLMDLLASTVEPLKIETSSGHGQ